MSRSKDINKESEIDINKAFKILTSVFLCGAIALLSSAGFIKNDENVGGSVAVFDETEADKKTELYLEYLENYEEVDVFEELFYDGKDK